MTWLVDGALLLSLQNHERLHEKILHRANVSFSEHKYFKAELADFEVNYKLFELLDQA